MLSHEPGQPRAACLKPPHISLVGFRSSRGFQSPSVGCRHSAVRPACPCPAVTAFSRILILEQTGLHCLVCARLAPPPRGEKREAETRRRGRAGRDAERRGRAGRGTAGGAAPVMDACTEGTPAPTATQQTNRLAGRRRHSRRKQPPKDSHSQHQQKPSAYFSGV